MHGKINDMRKIIQSTVVVFFVVCTLVIWLRDITPEIDRFSARYEQVETTAQLPDYAFSVSNTNVSVMECVRQIELIIALKENQINRKLFPYEMTNMVMTAIAFMPDFFTTRIGLQNVYKENTFMLQPVPEIYSRSYLLKARRPGQKISDLANSLGELSPVMYENMTNDYSLQVFCNRNFSNELNVTEIDIEKFRNNFNQYNKDAAATNELVKTKAELIRGMSQAGTNILDIIKMYSENTWDDERLKPCEFGADDFENASNWIILKNMSLNTMSQIFEIPDGYAMYYKIDEKPAEGVITAYMVFFRRAFELEPLSNDEIRDFIYDEKRQNVLKTFIISIKKQYEPVFSVDKEHFKQTIFQKFFK